MINILIADDNPVQTEQLSNVLSKEKDFKVIKVANDGNQALNDYISLKPDVLLLDLDMPKINGLDVIEYLSNLENTMKQNIIIISGSTVFRSQISNANKVKWIFNKPFDYNKLFYEIREIKKEENYNPTFDKNLDILFQKLDMKPYTKGTVYLKSAIKFAYYESSFDINVSKITKEIALKYQISHYGTIQSIMDKTVNSIYFKHSSSKTLKSIFSTDYKFTTKDFIYNVIYYIDHVKE